MTPKVSDIIEIINEMAPLSLSEKWDNTGLQVGGNHWNVKKIWISLDPTTDIISAACKDKADFLITHHPLIFEPLTSIDVNTPVGSAIRMAMNNNLSIFSAHTNFDKAGGGLNDILAEKIGLKNVKALTEPEVSGDFKLVFYVPPECERSILNALFQTNAGKIGQYTCCTFINKGNGTFKPGPQTKPFTGKKGRLSYEEELRIETVVPKKDIHNIVNHLKENHPYETMAYDIYPLHKTGGDCGIGRTGELGKKTKLMTLAKEVKQALGLKSIRMVGNPKLSVKRIAVCTGSGAGMLKNVVLSGAQAFITGDMKYHDARTAEEYGLGLIDIGHFHSERIFVEALEKRLKHILHEHSYDVKVKACKSEKDPFKQI